MTTDTTIRGVVRLHPERAAEPPPWLLAVQKDLARDTAESAFTDLFAGAGITATITEQVLDRLIAKMADLMTVAYREVGITDPAAIVRLRRTLGLAFLERFDELTAQVERGGLA